VPKITYIESTGITTTGDVAIGESLMQGALQHGVRGILAECGGSCACGTCRVHIDDAWKEKAGAASAIEEDIMDGVMDPHPNKRLSCQVTVTELLDGMIVRLPKSQI
jgi:2Fe-2S ferredoxin